MNRFFLAAFAVLLPLGTAVAQILQPVSWTTSVRSLDGGKLELVASAKIDAGWHVYSQFIGSDGPIPTAFKLPESKDLKTEGPVREPKPIKEFDKNFGMELAYFAKKADFVIAAQRISPKAFTYTAEVEFMVCDDERCLPPDYVNLVFKVPAAPAAGATASPTDADASTGTDPAAKTPTTEAPADEATPAEEPAAEAGDVPVNPETPAEAPEALNLWALFGAGMLGGFFALIMPCIFPMIPLTVSFFLKQSKSKADGVRKALIYGLSINVIYVALGLLVTVVFGSDALNAMATNPWFNLAFFALFVVFAISFFGAFEITLPSSWVNKADDQSQRGGLLGIFFMAFTLALVSFSCTGPLIGQLLVATAVSGELLGPAMGMFGFSFALSLPFVLFAAFPGWLKGLPKSGGWLNTVKVTLGFLELAFALKFLSTADMVWQQHWLERELFLALWVAIAFATALYLFGVFRMPHDDEPKGGLGVGRMLTGLLFLVAGFYLLPGIWGAPVKLVAGFPPPAFYAENPNGMGSGSAPAADAKLSEDAHCPLNLPCFNDLEEARAYALEAGKPLLLDFTGWGCVNCRKMEEEVWSRPEVRRRLAEDVVLVSLYVDERSKLPESEVRVSETTGKTIKTVGQKWGDLQAQYFNANAQPYYVLMDPAVEAPNALNGHTAYDPDPAVFLNWLDAGLKIYAGAK
ncbi:MAG: thioredoxin family protein [Cryomorphaceae bacterium]|jgi:thiol:disulfide interchange protein DsbD|nr:thioredoxin family protein [Cryomorphaceae bacterium]